MLTVSFEHSMNRTCLEASYPLPGMKIPDRLTTSASKKLKHDFRDNRTENDKQENQAEFSRYQTRKKVGSSLDPIDQTINGLDFVQHNEPPALLVVQ